MKVGVVVPCVNQFQLCLDALISVNTQFDWEPYIIPNWRMKVPLAAAWNRGVDRAIDRKCDYILVINDDVVLSPWTIDNQIKFLEEHRDDDEKAVLTTGWSVPPPKAGDAHSMMHFPEPNPGNAWINAADFACFMITPWTFKIVGGFDENFDPAYFEDNDYHRRILLMGYYARVVTTAPYYHYGSKTQHSNAGVTTKAFDKCKEYYKKKWGGAPGAETFSTPFNDPEKSLKEW